MQYIEYLKKYLVFTGFFCFFLNSSAGSYEDFFKAVQFDDVKTVQALLQRGFDPNTVNPAGQVGRSIGQGVVAHFQVSRYWRKFNRAIKFALDSAGQVA